jgi:hypothetical protein
MTRYSFVLSALFALTASARAQYESSQRWFADPYPVAYTPAPNNPGPIPGWQWHCNAYHVDHDRPRDCSNPERGGHWVRVNDPRNPINNYVGLMQFAQSRGFTVTSTTGGTHNPGSAHRWGGAVDVRTWDKTSAQVNDFISEARAQGITVLDERTRPFQNKSKWGGADPGTRDKYIAGLEVTWQPVWAGPHLHLQVSVTP